MKNEKDGFTSSGNSPTQYSSTGAPIGTGRGVEETKRRIREAFEQARKDPPPTTSLTPPQDAPPTTPAQRLYTEDCAAKFQERAKRLAATALTSAHIFKTKRSNVHEIVVPSESAEDLIKEATRRHDD